MASPVASSWIVHGLDNRPQSRSTKQKARRAWRRLTRGLPRINVTCDSRQFEMAMRVVSARITALTDRLGVYEATINYGPYAVREFTPLFGT